MAIEVKVYFYVLKSALITSIKACLAQYSLARPWLLPQALPTLQKVLLPGSFRGPVSSDCEDHAGSNEGNGMSSPPTVEGTEASAESNSPSRCPNLAQDTERAADQTRKSKSHSKTKDKDW